MGAEQKVDPALLERLREQIRRVQASPRQMLVTLSTGLKEVDSLGAFRLGGVVELSGEEASGRTSLSLKLVATACREKRLSAWVDGPRELYPPAAVPLGVELERLLIVRPKAPGQLVWSAIQLLRSGAFTLVVLDVTHTGVRLTLTDTRKLIEAARAGGALLVVLTSQAAPAPGLMRLEFTTKPVFPSPPEESVNRPLSPVKLVFSSTRPSEQAVSSYCRGGLLGEVALEHTLEVVHRGAARRLSFARSRFSAHGGSGRLPLASQALAPGLAPPVVLSLVSHQRPKRNQEREGGGQGGCGFYGYGHRPGRDVPMQLPRGAEQERR